MEKKSLSRRYSIARVQKRFREIYDLSIIKKDLGYKGQRYVPYTLYDAVTASGEVIMENITLNALGDFLASQDEY